MKVVVASGKGGTGKTTVATNLALAASRAGYKTGYLDCDVEEPNGHLFLNPRIEKTTEVGVGVPEVDEEKCIHCGKCSDICRYSAIVNVKDKVLVFPELCHSCAGCWIVCPEKAISETKRRIGVLEEGLAEEITFVHGRLDVGQIMSPPLIKAVRAVESPEFEIIDAPPGTSCPVITTMKGTDFVLLVTEPTPFGLHDLDLAVDTVRELGIPHAVVVNRAEEENRSAIEFCKEKGVEIASSIPDDRRVAEAYSRGIPIVDAIDEYGIIFEKMIEFVRESVGRTGSGGVN